MKAALFLLAFVSGFAQAAPFANGSAENGRKLLAKYECATCHQARMGGDGSAIFTRGDRLVREADQLIPRIKFCSGNIGANLTAQEEQDLAAYLNQRYYHFR